MADKKISQLTAATTPLGGTEVLPIVQSGATVKATVANIVGAGTSPGSFTTATASAGMFAPFAFAGNANNSFNAYATNAAINYGGVFTGGLDGSGIPYAQISVWNNAKVDVATLRSTGDMTLNVGNYVVGTSGKGVSLPGGITWTSGSGSPEGVVTAPVGSLYSRSDGGLLTSLYVKESGSGNTGWAGK
jgi:hypothetical protein